MSMIAIIPARSGSKGLKNKNIRSLNGKPLISYTIEAANKSGVFDTIMVSTDSKEYADIAEKYGAEVPFLRSEESASDTASTRTCVLEVLSRYSELGKQFNKVFILQPTSPLRTWKNIVEANKLFEEKNAKSIISVSELSHSIKWSNTIDNSLSLNKFILPEDDCRRQDFEKYYMLNGAIFLHDTKYYIDHEYYFDDTSFAYIMETEESIDIDSEFDFLIAETILKKKLDMNI